MNVIGICGSPRIKGNAARLLDAILGQIAEQGGTTKKYHLNTLNIKGCQACYSCKQPGKEGTCAVKDDMQPILEDILSSEAVILASPVYMWQMTAQAKLFTDRLMPLLKPDFSTVLTGQKLLSIYTQGMPDPLHYAAYFQHVNEMFGFLGFRTIAPLAFAGLQGPSDVEQQPDWADRLSQARVQLMG